MQKLVDRTASMDRLGAMMSEWKNKDQGLSRAPQASQIRAARALLDWSEAELAQAAGITTAMVAKIERGTIQPSKKAMAALQSAFGAAGVLLLSAGDQPEEGLGVRLRKGELPVP